MSLKIQSKERIKRHQRRSETHQKMRDRTSGTRELSSAIYKIRESIGRAEMSLRSMDGESIDQQAERALTTSTIDDMKRRLAHLERVESSESMQIEEKIKCAESVEYWFDWYAWTYDPRTVQKYIPLAMWEKQREFVTWFGDREKAKEDGIVEKSRDAGATWLTIMILFHHWLFIPGFKGAVGSRKEDLVDETGNPDSIFEKLRDAAKLIPGWMMPKGLKPKNHFAYMKFINPEIGSTITGEAGDNIGRGGRASVYVIDEAAFIARPQKVEAALSMTSDVKIYVSTPNGIGNVFYKKRFSKAFPVFTFNWKDDPRKAKWEVVDGNGTIISIGVGRGPASIPDHHKIRFPWYEGMKKKYEHDPVILAQEIDIDYSASQEGITIPATWVRAAIGLRLPRVGVIRGGLDVADEGGSKNVLCVRQGPFVHAIYHWTKGNTTQTAWKAIGLLEKHGATEFVYDSAGGYGSGIKGATQSSERVLSVSVKGINVGNPAGSDKWDDGKKGSEKFMNLKAELWWKLRRRFERAYEYVEMGIQHDPMDMISIPDHPDLIAQLSVVQHYETETGKVRIESKKELKARGVSSPDFAEALVLTESKVTQFDVAAGGMPSMGGMSGVNFQGAGVAVANVGGGQRDRRVDE
jgi:phage terminase large subunit